MLDDLKGRLDWYEASCIVAAQLPYLPELRRPPYNAMQNPLAGMCYVASEAIWWLSRDPLVPRRARYAKGPGKTHWWLVLEHGDDFRVVDATASQFPYEDLPAMYDKGRRSSFIHAPSRRCRAVLSRIDSNTYFRRLPPNDPTDTKEAFKNATVLY